jgi:transposase
MMAKGRPAGLRLETAVRTQIEFQQSSLDDLLGPDHRARQVWDYVEELDLSALYGRVQTTVSSSGRPAIDPAILVSLWLYATLEGVGSARLLDRLCKSDSAYLWLLGGVGVNYHTLSDFRASSGAVLDELLSQSLSGLIASGSVDVRTLAVDGMKLQSLASGRSFKSVGSRRVGWRRRRIGHGGWPRRARRTPRSRSGAMRRQPSSAARRSARITIRPAPRSAIPRRGS